MGSIARCYGLQGDDEQMNCQKTAHLINSKWKEKGTQRRHKKPEARFLAMSGGEEVAVGGKLTDECEPSSLLSSHGLVLHR